MSFSIVLYRFFYTVNEGGFEGKILAAGIIKTSTTTQRGEKAHSKKNRKSHRAFHNFYLDCDSDASKRGQASFLLDLSFFMNENEAFILLS